MEGRQGALPKKRERRKVSMIPFLKKPKKPKELLDEHFEEIVNSFYIIDTNQDGRLSRKELNEAAFIVGMNPTPKELKEWWSKADMDGDGFISLEEYVKVMSTNFVSIDIEKERMKAAFSLLDRNNDGRITQREFRAVMMYNNEMTVKEADELFKEVDAKGRGYLNYEDFIESHICSVMFQ